MRLSSFNTDMIFVLLEITFFSVGNDKKCQENYFVVAQEQLNKTFAICFLFIRKTFSLTKEMDNRLVNCQ